MIERRIMIFFRKILLAFLIVFTCLLAYSQNDSASLKKDTSLFLKGAVDTSHKKTDSLVRKKHTPRQAAIRSAILPGLGQIYNGKAWKVPIVYIALGFPAYQFFDNKLWYDRTKYAYAVIVTRTTNADSLNRVHPKLRPFVERQAAASILNYRNEFRRNMDYSILFFLLFWALNIVDATVDAHLRDFDVGNNLSLRIKPSFNQVNYGLCLAFNFHQGRRTLPLR